MKQLITTSLIISALILLSSCATKAPVAPSQNSDLNKISNSNSKAKPRLMQKSLDNWLKDEWTPIVNQDKKVQEKYLKKADDNTQTHSNNTEVKYVEDKEKDFTLQEYVDKTEAYLKAHPSDEKDSHVKKLESMPVIGE